jgi:Raf kinase inhibitor-like YbhB/YbcL family protein
MEIISSSFKAGESIPARFTCDDTGFSPPLFWLKVPQDTKSFALIVDDPDASSITWVHWVLFNIPATQRELLENIPNTDTLENGASQGMNDSRKIGYSGPCPPTGTHRYYFKLYALDIKLDLRPGITKKELMKAMEGHILEEAQLMGRYKRRP